MERRHPPARPQGTEDDNRLTVLPTFDVAQYARDSDAMARTEPGPSSEEPSLAALEEMSDHDLERIYWNRLGSESRVVVIVRTAEELLRIPRGAAEGFVLSFVDGERTIGALLRACELPRLAALASLCELLDKGVVGLRASP